MTSPLIPPTPSEVEYLGRRDADAREPELAADDPFALFAAWLAEAQAGEPNDANAMALATVDAEGLPDARMVLLKDVDAAGFVFYTNVGSAKGGELGGQPRAALLFHWKSLRRQVRVRGTVSRGSEAEADAYFASRARDSQLGAWASEQSRPLSGRDELERRVAEARERFADTAVPRPEDWAGFRVTPLSIEFWRDRPFRLHERLLFTRDGDGWATSRLYP